MRKTFVSLCLVACAAAASLTGCSSSSGDPAQRAAELIKAKGLDVPSFSSMDSVMGYPEAFACEMTALDTERRADSLLQANIKAGTVSANRRELETMGEVVFSLKKGAAEIKLREGLARNPKVFVGYEVLIADSLSNDIIRVMLDKDMKNAVIGKIKVR